LTYRSGANVLKSINFYRDLKKEEGIFKKGSLKKADGLNKKASQLVKSIVTTSSVLI
jgi:hypothetical protein